MEKRIIQIGDNVYKLVFDNFDENVDIDSLLTIDYSNLIGELVTFPVILNRFGILLAEAESQVAETKLNMDVYEAKIKERLRIELATQNNGKNPTVETLNNVVMSNKVYQAMKHKCIEVVKTRDYINSMFWACKDKASKLEKLSLSIQPGDLPDSVIEGRVNNVLIKRTRKVIE